MELKNAFLNLSTRQLQRAITLKRRIESLQDKLGALIGESGAASEASAAPASRVIRRKRRMSPAGRARIAKAARARWALWRAKQGKK